MNVNSWCKVRARRVYWVLALLVGLLLVPALAHAQAVIYLECGDAPSSYNLSGTAMTAYPKGGPPGVTASFPVVVAFTAPDSPDGHGMCHLGGVSFLGPALAPSKSLEQDADHGADQDGVNNIDPLTDTPDRDGHDDGVTFPAALPSCSPVEVSVEGTVGVAAALPDYYIDAWFDWNRDGDWNDGVVCGRGDNEWAIQDYAVSPNPVTGHFSESIEIVPCNPVSDTDPIWARVTLSDTELKLKVGDEWAAGGIPTGGECLDDGETEDYYLTPKAPPEEEEQEEFVPEPGSVILLTSGLAGLAGYATLRRRIRG
jgi:hypothetical protein